jgi:putative copper export protein
MSPDPVSILARAAGWLALLQAGGCALFLLLFGAALERSTAAIGRAGRCAAAAALLLILAHQLLEPARMAGEYAGVADGRLQRLAWHTTAGAAALLQMAAMLLLFPALGRLPAAGRAPALAGTVLGVAAFTLSGHTSTLPLRPLLAPLLVLHVAIVVFWAGALLPLRFACAREAPAVRELVLRRFSAIAGALVPLIALAGLALAWLLSPDASVLGRPYGRLLAAKAGAFVLLMVLAALNRWRWAPQAAAGRPGAGIALQRSIGAEGLLIVAVIVVTATLTTLYSPAD